LHIYYKNTALDIYLNNNLIQYDINREIDIQRVREEFNSMVEELSLEYNSLVYWGMRISERNTLSSTLFLDICKIKLLEKLSQESQDIKIFTNNIALYTHFKRRATFGLQEHLKFQVKKMLVEKRVYLDLFKFIIKKSLFSLKYSRKKYRKDLSDTTVLQTWVSDSNFLNNTFKDSYYKDLALYLKKNKKSVVTWLVFYNLKNQKNAMQHIRKNSDKFLIIEDYLTLQDYFSAIKVFFQKRFFSFKESSVGTTNISLVIEHHKKLERVEHTHLFYRFTKKLTLQKNITFLQNFENMMPEKMLILGVREYLESSQVIGYFHTTKPKNLLCLEYAGVDEFKIAPKPETIIFHSDTYKVYYQHLYRTINAYNGIAFKQLHFRNILETEVEKTDEILVVFSGVESDVTLIFDLLNSLDKEYFFIFRMHPMYHFNVKKQYKKTNYKIENNMALNLLFSTINKVISTYSSVAVEAALNGLKVGLLYNKKVLLLNPFDDTHIKNYQLISDRDELKLFLNTVYKNQKIEQLFNIDEKDRTIFLELT